MKLLSTPIETAHVGFIWNHNKTRKAEDITNENCRKAENITNKNDWSGG